MSFKCKKCDYTTDREHDLERHLNRKIPCYRSLSCNRCDKEFTQLSNLTRHVNRINICEDRRDIKELELRIEQERVRVEQERARVEQEKNKGKELDIKLELTRNPKMAIAIQNKSIHTNIENQTIGNQFNINTTINNYHHEYNKTKSQIESMIVANDLVQTLQNFFKNQYNNPDFNENKCLQIDSHDGVNKVVAYIKTDDGFKQVGYTEIKPYIKKHIKEQINDIIDNHEKLSEDDMLVYSIPQKDFIEDDKIKTVKKIPRYVNSERNNKTVKTQLEVALN
jgi:uncharacterized C2H2 Zn-finger protein